MLVRSFSTKIRTKRTNRVPVRLLNRELQKEKDKAYISRQNMPMLPYTSESAELIRKQSRLVLIRHGNSMFNQLFHELEGPGYIEKPSYFDVYSDLQIMDSPLSKLGIAQAKKAAELAHQIEFEIVFISPLRRALETAYYMFKDHPNFENIKFIVHPMMRENIMTTGDLPSDINSILSVFSKKFPDLCTRYLPQSSFGDFDELYYARDFSPDLKKKLMGLDKLEVDLKLSKEISTNFPKSIEKYEYTNARVQQMKEVIHQRKYLDWIARLY
jgi:hypothetical protein